MQWVHMFKIPHLQRIVRVILHMLRVLYVLERGGEIPHLGKQVIKVPGFEPVGMEEFLDDNSKSNGNIPMHFLGS